MTLRTFEASLTVYGMALWLGASGCENSAGIRRDGASGATASGTASGGATASGGLTAQGGASGTAGAGGSTGSPDCRADKIAFTQDTGCLHDDSVEFCLPANDSAAVSQVTSIDSTVACQQGSRGRADCKPDTELLCLLPMPQTQCPMYSPMPDALWSIVCRLAALDVVAKIVPTWYE